MRIIEFGSLLKGMPGKWSMMRWFKRWSMFQWIICFLNMRYYIIYIYINCTNENYIKPLFAWILHSSKLRWQWNMDHLKMYFLRKHGEIYAMLVYRRTTFLLVHMCSETACLNWLCKPEKLEVAVFEVLQMARHHRRYIRSIGSTINYGGNLDTLRCHDLCLGFLR